MQGFKVVKEPIPLKDGVDKVTGIAQFVADVQFHGPDPGLGLFDSPQEQDECRRTVCTQVAQQGPHSNIKGKHARID